MKKTRKNPEERANLIKRIVQQVTNTTRATEFYRMNKDKLVRKIETNKEKEEDTDPTTPAE